MLAVALFLHRCTADLKNNNYFLVRKGCGGGIYLGLQQCLVITPVMRQNCQPPHYTPALTSLNKIRVWTFYPNYTFAGTFLFEESRVRVEKVTLAGLE